jgi:hypothetical protein
MLGDFDPASMPHRDRAFLSIGNVGVAALFSFALVILARLDVGLRTRRLARAGAIVALVSLAAAVLGTVGLIWWHAAVLGIWTYAVAAGIAWALTGYAMFHEYRGVFGWTALATAIVYGLAIVAIFAGAFVIFLMTVGAAPFAIGLLIWPPGSRRPSGGSPPVAYPSAL